MSKRRTGNQQRGALLRQRGTSLEVSRREFLALAGKSSVAVVVAACTSVPLFPPLAQAEVTPAPSIDELLFVSAFMPPQDAPTIVRLRAAGAILLGKTNVSELGIGYCWLTHSVAKKQGFCDTSAAIDYSLGGLAMSLKPSPIPPVPHETARVARAAFPKGNLYLKLRDQLGTLVQDEDFVALFSKEGPPGLPPWRLALVTIFQFREHLSDRQATEAVRARIDWKYVLSLEPSDPGFDFSVLSEFRARLVRVGPRNCC